MKRITMLLVAIVLMASAAQNSYAQSSAGRIAFGIDAEGNKLYSNFRDNQFFFSGDAFIRWNILDWLSLHVAYNGGQLRMRLNDDNLKAYPEYFGSFGTGIGDGSKRYPVPGSVTPTNPDGTPTDINRETKNKIRHSGFQIMLSGNVYPSQTFVPFVLGGVEIFNFAAKNLDQDKDLPYLAAVGYDRNTIGMVGGVGFEMYLSDYITFGGKGLIHVVNTDYLDDFSQKAYDAFHDGVAPVKDAGTSTDAFLTFGVGFSYYIFGEQDVDHDGLSNSAEKEIYHTDPNNPDTDGDGLMDGDEVRKYHTDPTKADTDGDGLSDAEEVNVRHTDPVNADTDGDGLNDGQEVKTYNTDPINGDSDNDGLKDGEEVSNYKTDPMKSDTDGDGLADGDEVKKYNTSPTKLDSDSDGLNDGDEVNKYSTDPSKADTDDDGLSDGAEVKQYNTDPKVVDTDKDGLRDGDEVNKYTTKPDVADTDNDGLSDGEEVNRTKTNPLNPDTDADGFKDGVDRCPLIAGVAPNGCPPKPPVNTIANFPGVIFIVNTDNFDLRQPGTIDNLNKIKALIEQCDDIKVDIEGHASSEGDAARNQELSDMRAARVKSWLIDQGVNPKKISKTIGYGSSRPVIPEPKLGKKVTAAMVEQARAQNRRIAVKVVETCK